ncbi:MAG: UDP-N-acetylmuramoyl-L-alanyl-D-glutamate--2,6-diaminopimelate ligase [Pirellulales bacterium]
MRSSLPSAAGVSLRSILPEARFLGADDIRVASCSSDPRKCQPGDLFAALVGSRRDGHDHVHQAVKRGAAGVLGERFLPVGSLPLCMVSDSRAAFGRICQALVGQPTQRLKVIGVSGSRGKTSVAWLLAAIFEQAGIRAGLLSSLGYCDTEQTAPATRPTPSATTLATWLARMEANGCTHAVVEVSSHALAQRRMAGVEFDVACLTNVRREQIGYHGSLANYRRVMGRLLEQLRGEGLVALNTDDPGARGFLDGLPGPALTVGLESAAEITASIVERSPSEQTFLLSAGADTIPVRTPILGDHHVLNCLLATAVGLGYGLPLPTIVRGLEAVNRLPGRLERLECGQPFATYVDEAHSPGDLATSLRAVREAAPGRVICLLGADDRLPAEVRRQQVAAIEREADIAIVTQQRHGNAELSNALRQMLGSFEGLCQVKELPDRTEAFAWALGLARPGDAVVVAGANLAGLEPRPGALVGLDDREVACRLLYAAGQERAPAELQPATRLPR